MIELLRNWFRGVFGTTKALPPNPAARGYFLGIGLDRVDPAAYGGWEGRLNACRKDIRALSYTLTTGTRWARPLALLDENATIQGVMRAYKELAAAAVPGDLVVIAHSRHGGQFVDTDDDERDGLDETLVLFDGQVPDDVHAHWLSWFKPGVRVVLLADTCHSATFARATLAGLTPVGLLPSEARTKAMPRDIANLAGDLHEDQIRALRKAYPAPAEIRASVLTLAACKDNQSAMDGDENGQFTAAFLMAWAKREPKDYPALIKAIRKRCPDQTPQLTWEGPSADVAAFRNQKPFTL